VLIAEELDNHQILPKSQSPSDHTSLVTTITIEKEHTQMKKQSISKDSEEKKEFVKNLGNKLSVMDTTNIPNAETLECITQALVSIIKDLWNKHSKSVNITRQSKEWWNKEYSRNLAVY